MRFSPFPLFSFPFWCFLTALRCSVLASPELCFHPYSGFAFHYTWKYSCFLRVEGVVVPQGSFPPASPAILWSTDRARSSPCTIKHTMKHHGPSAEWSSWGCDLGRVVQSGCKALTDTELLNNYPSCKLPISDSEWWQMQTQGRDLQAFHDFEHLLESTSGTWSLVCWRGRCAHQQKSRSACRFHMLSGLFMWTFLLVILSTCLCFPNVPAFSSQYAHGFLQALLSWPVQY